MCLFLLSLTRISHVLAGGILEQTHPLTHYYFLPRLDQFPRNALWVILRAYTQFPQCQAEGRRILVQESTQLHLKLLDIRLTCSQRLVFLVHWQAGRSHKVASVHDVQHQLFHHVILALEHGRELISHPLVHDEHVHLPNVDLGVEFGWKFGGAESALVDVGG